MYLYAIHIRLQVNTIILNPFHGIHIWHKWLFWQKFETASFTSSYQRHRQFKCCLNWNWNWWQTKQKKSCAFTETMHVFWPISEMFTQHWFRGAPSEEHRGGSSDYYDSVQMWLQGLTTAWSGCKSHKAECGAEGQLFSVELLPGSTPIQRPPQPYTLCVTLRVHNTGHRGG